MSALPRYDPSLGYAGLRMDADEYLSLGETRQRYELVDGVIVMSPSPFFTHNEIVMEIGGQFRDFSRSVRRLRIASETDMRLAATLVYCPDLAVYEAERLPKEVKKLTLPPDLVLEVLSQSTKAFDLITKRDDYARFGVREYWVVDPTNGDLRQWSMTGTGTYEERPVAGDLVVSTAIDGFQLDLKPVRELAG